MLGKKSSTLVIPILLGLLLSGLSFGIVPRTSKAFAVSKVLRNTMTTSTTAPTLVLPFYGSFPVSGNSYGCGDHLDYSGTKYHDTYAIDFGLPSGTPVAAITGGYAYYGSDGATTNYGNFVWIQHPGGFVSVYAHLSNIYIQQGMWVPQGWHIADSGSTGHSTGPHLHFSLRKDATNISDGVPAIPEPMSGYRDFKYYGYTSARGGAPNNCQAVDTTTKFNSANAMTRQTLLAVEVPLMGISYRTSVGDNNNPNPNWSYMNVQVFNTSNQMVANIWNQAVYRTIPGVFVDYADLGSNFPGGIYYVRVRMNGTLGQYVYGVNVVTGLETFVSLPKVVGGDVDNNNQLDIVDYNDLIMCLQNKSGCTPTLRAGSDLNRDGVINGGDYNILLRYLSGQSGV